MYKKLPFVGLFIMSLTCSVYAQPIVTDSTSTSTVKSDSVTTLKSPPPSAISPTINNNNSDLCTTGVAGAVQTQILGFSSGMTIRDLNCERLKLSKTLYDMGMKVAAVSTLCQDERVFDAMMMAGTPCPYDGMIGYEAKAAWQSNPERMPKQNVKKTEGISDEIKTWLGGAVIGALFLLFLF
jgi:hypothetical protein